MQLTMFGALCGVSASSHPAEGEDFTSDWGLQRAVERLFPRITDTHRGLNGHYYHGHYSNPEYAARVREHIYRNLREDLWQEQIKGLRGCGEGRPFMAKWSEPPHSQVAGDKTYVSLLIYWGEIQ